MSELQVYLEDFENSIGILEGDRGFKSVSFRYLPEYLQRDDAVALSLRMPLQEETFGDYPTKAFFANVLPEGERKEKAAALYRIDQDDVFGLLEHLGRECAGSVSVVPVEEPRGKTPGVLALDYEPLSDHDLNNLVVGLSRGLAPRRQARFSLAGVQRKAAVAVLPDRRIAEPKDGAPTTHVMKVGSREYPALVENELFCLKLAKAMGLPTANAEMGSAGGVNYLLVERYDRVVENDLVRRLHQEDLCQALGYLPGLKYEEDGGPGFKEVFGVSEELDDPLGFVENLLKVTVLNVLVGNGDAHAKNFSLVYRRGERPVLAPFYDLVCVALYGGHDGLSMKIGDHALLEGVGKTDWMALAKVAGVAPRLMTRIVEEMTVNVLDHCEGVFGDIPGLKVTQARRVRDYVGQQVTAFSESWGLELNIETDLFVPLIQN